MDSLFSLALKKAKEIKRRDYQVKLLHLQAFLHLQHNHINRAKTFAGKAVHIGLEDSVLMHSVITRDAISFLAMAYYYASKYDSSIFWIKKGKFLCGKTDLFNLSILTSLEGVNLAGSNDRIDHAILKFDSAYALALSTADPNDDVMALFNKLEARFHSKQGRWGKSIESLIQIRERLDNSEYFQPKRSLQKRISFLYRQPKATLYRILSMAYFALEDFENASYYQALVVKEFYEKKNFVFLPYVLLPLAQYESFKTNNYSMVAKLYDSCLTLIRQYHKSDKLKSSAFYFVRAWLQEQKGNLHASVSDYKEAYKLENEDPYSIQVSLPGLMHTLVRSGRKKSSDSLMNIIQSKFPFQDPFLNSLIHHSLADYFEMKGLQDKKIYHLIRYYKLNDSLQTAGRYYTVKEIETRLKTKEKDIELAQVNQIKELLEQELNRKNKEAIALVVGLVIMLTLSLALYYNFKTKKHQAELLEQKNNQIETLIRELHHRVKNNMQTISSLLSLQQYRITDKNAKAALKEGQMRVEAMSLIHQKLYLNNGLNEVNMDDYLNSLSRALADSYGFDISTIKKRIGHDEKNLNVDVAIPLGLIINELIVNAFKHAFAFVESPELKIILERNKQNQLELIVRDNGPGLPEIKLKDITTFGLRLVQTLSGQLNASLMTRNDNGAVFQIIINN